MPGFIDSVGFSSGQVFRRRGETGKDFSVAIGDIEAMSNRLLIAGRESAYEAQQVIEDEIVKYVHPSSDHGFKYSEGRLAATIGTFKPDLINDDRVLARTIEWAVENGVSNQITDTGSSGERTVIEYGAYKSVKRYRASTYSVEVGTFTPYAGLVEDGGEMIVHPYGNTNVAVMAHWEAHNMFAKGMFDAEVILANVIQGKVKAAM